MYSKTILFFSFIENPLFATTNNIYSFSLAEDWLDSEPFVCLNADVVFDSEILLPALESTAPVTMIVDPAWRDETMKVIISGDRVVSMNKRIPQSAGRMSPSERAHDTQNRSLPSILRGTGTRRHELDLGT